MSDYQVTMVKASHQSHHILRYCCKRSGQP